MFLRGSPWCSQGGADTLGKTPPDGTRGNIPAFGLARGKVLVGRGKVLAGRGKLVDGRGKELACRGKVGFSHL